MNKESTSSSTDVKLNSYDDDDDDDEDDDDCFPNSGSLFFNF